MTGLDDALARWRAATERDWQRQYARTAARLDALRAITRTRPLTDEEHEELCRVLEENQHALYYVLYGANATYYQEEDEKYLYDCELLADGKAVQHVCPRCGEEFTYTVTRREAKQRGLLCLACREATGAQQPDRAVAPRVWSEPASQDIAGIRHEYYRRYQQ